VGKNGKVDIFPLAPPLVRAFRIYRGVGLKKATPGIDAVDGVTSRVTPHCFRRAWATIALNDEKNPTPIDVWPWLAGRQPTRRS
jgi:integrase